MVRRVETGVDEWSWSAEVTYACACGAYSSVTRWRWVDAEAQPELARRLRDSGPLAGACKACQRPAEGGGAWLELSPVAEQATLVLAADQRGELLEALQVHLDQLRGRPGQVRPWLLQPRLAFGTAGVPVAASDERGAGIPKPVGELSAEIQRALVCDLTLAAGGVAAIAVLDEPTRRMWGSAALQARPVLLRGLGFPLLGVRLVASYLGEVAVIDAVVDIGEARSSEIFMRLAQAFRLQLLVRSDTGQASAVREIEAESLNRNAAMCLESAQGQLGAGEFPPDAYRTACDSLARMSAKQRMEPARSTLAEGSYRHLVSPGEALAALERLDAASKKDNLARLLEVDGLPVVEYEQMRRSVLAAAVEFGLPAPARFWRRTLGADLVRDPADWIHRLVANRSAWIIRGDDLTPEQAEQAWRAILDLCQHHDVTPPPELTQAIGLQRDAPRGEGREGREGIRSGLHVVATSRVEPGRGPTPGAALAGPRRPPSTPTPVATVRRPESRPEPVRDEPAEPARTAAELPRSATERPRPTTVPAEPRAPAEMPRPGGMPRPRRSSQPAVAVSGEIGGGLGRPSAATRTSEIHPETRAPEHPGGGDPKQRVARAITTLGGSKPADALPLLVELDDDDLLAVLPPLAEVSGRLVPELLVWFQSPRRPLRQAAAIVLGLARDRRAIDPLAALLGSEPTPVWVDVARALGNFGPRVVGPLCALLRGAAPEAKEGLGQRVARTFAELVVSDGDAPGGAGRLAVENLLEVADPTVSSAARRALATLADVRGEARGTGGAADDREIRRFSTRAYEAITTPELDADGDIEVVGDD